MTDQELRNVIRLAVALALSLPFAFETWWLIGSAWVACDQAGPGAGFWLNTGILPLLLGTGWATYVAALFFGRRIPLAARLLGATALFAVICLGVTANQVPIYGEDFYETPGPGPECGPGGIPTWWPDWLPS